jgi:hypothetical protein
VARARCTLDRQGPNQEPKDPQVLCLGAERPDLERSRPEAPDRAVLGVEKNISGLAAASAAGKPAFLRACA